MSVFFFLLPVFPASHCRFMKPAPMFLDRNFKRLAKVSNYLPPFGFKTQGKKGSFHHLPSTSVIYFHFLNNMFKDCVRKNEGHFWFGVWFENMHIDMCRSLTAVPWYSILSQSNELPDMCVFNHDDDERWWNAKLGLSIPFPYQAFSYCTVIYLWHQWCNLLNWSTNCQHLLWDKLLYSVSQRLIALLWRGWVNTLITLIYS